MKKRSKRSVLIFFFGFCFRHNKRIFNFGIYFLQRRNEAFIPFFIDKHHRIVFTYEDGKLVVVFVHFNGGNRIYRRLALDGVRGWISTAKRTDC